MVTTITLGCVRPQKQLLLKNDSAPALLATERLPPLKKSPKPRVGAWEGMHPGMAQVKDGKTGAKETDCDARRVLEDLRERKERCEPFDVAAYVKVLFARCLQATEAGESAKEAEM